MGFVLQVSHNGRTSQYPFDRFARVGSASECQVRISDTTVPAQALMILADGANGFRALVKADGLIINGQAVAKETAIPFGVGSPLQMGNVSLTMIVTAVASIPVVQAVQRQVLPGVADSPALSARTPETSALQDKKNDGNVVPLLVGIFVCVVGIVGIFWWMFVGQNSTLASAADEKTLKTIPVMIQTLRTADETTKALPEWSCGYISREEVIERLRGAYSLEARGRKAEAKVILKSIQLEMQKDIETDENGHFVLLEPVVKETAEGIESADGAGSKSKVSPSIVSFWFQDKQQQELYDFLARKCSDLDAKPNSDGSGQPSTLKK